MVSCGIGMILEREFERGELPGDDGRDNGLGIRLNVGVWGVRDRKRLEISTHSSKSHPVAMVSDGELGRVLEACSFRC